MELSQADLLSCQALLGYVVWVYDDFQSQGVVAFEIFKLQITIIARVCDKCEFFLDIAQLFTKILKFGSKICVDLLQPLVHI